MLCAEATQFHRRKGKDPRHGVHLDVHTFVTNAQISPKLLNELV